MRFKKSWKETRCIKLKTYIWYYNQQGHKKKIIKIKVKHQNIFSPSSIKCNESFTSLQKRNYMVKDEICDMWRWKEDSFSLRFEEQNHYQNSTRVRFSRFSWTSGLLPYYRTIWTWNTENSYQCSKLLNWGFLQAHRAHLKLATDIVVVLTIIFDNNLTYMTNGLFMYKFAINCYALVTNSST